AQRVEVELDLVPAAASHHGKQVREALRPEPAAAGRRRRHAVARAERAREPRAARLLGKMDEQIVAPRAQPAEQFHFPGEAFHCAERLPAPAHYVKLGERWMPLEHWRGIVVEQRVDLELRRMRLERR